MTEKTNAFQAINIRICSWLCDVRALFAFCVSACICMFTFFCIYFTCGVKRKVEYLSENVRTVCAHLHIQAAVSQQLNQKNHMLESRVQKERYIHACMHACSCVNDDDDLKLK